MPIARQTSIFLISLSIACSCDAATQTHDAGALDASRDAASAGSELDALSADASADGPEQQGACDVLFEDVERAFHRAVDSLPRQRASAALVSPCGVLTMVRGDSQPGAPLTADHRTRIGSVTKTYVAAALLNQLEADAVPATASIHDDADEIPHAESLTFDLLLGHRSGLQNYTDVPEFWRDFRADRHDYWARSRLMAYASGALQFDPNTAWAYSNTGYIAAGVLLERLSGENAAAVIGDLPQVGAAYLPLKPEPEQSEKFMHGYIGDSDETFGQHPSIAWTAGALVATPFDVAHWLHELFNGTVVSENVLNQMKSWSPLALGEYGLGLARVPASVVFGLSVYGHTGAIGSYGTHAFYIEEADAAWVVVTADGGQDPNPISADVMQVVAASLPES